MNKKLQTLTLRIFILILTFGLILSACTPAATEAPPVEEPEAMEEPTDEPAVELPETIKVGVVVPLTGRYAAGGDQVRNGGIRAHARG